MPAIQASKLSRQVSKAKGTFGGIGNLLSNKEKNGMPKVKEYTKNVAKSVFYATVDALKSTTPGISQFMSTNDDVFKEAYKSAVDYKETLKKAEKGIKNSKIYDAIDYGIKNMIEDAKTGKFYNNERDTTSAFFGDDFNLDLDFNDDDMKFDDSGSSSSSSGKPSGISTDLDNAIGAAASSQATAVAMSTNYIVGSNKQSTKLVIGQMDKMSAQITAGFGTMHNAISIVNSFFAGPLQTHLENSRKYYEESTKLLQEQNAMMKELLEMQRNLYKRPVDYNKGVNNTYDSIIGSGGIDLRAYGQNVLKNIKNYTSIFGMFGGSKDDGGGNLLKAAFANPLGAILTSIINGAMSDKFKKTLKSFDKAITSMFSQIVAELDKYKNDWGIKGVLANIFGIKINEKSSINTSNYEKGPVPFDGLTKQAIIETIPGYLARIEAAITGAGANHYDYDKGKWVKEKDIEKEWQKRKYEKIDQGTYGIRDDTRELINELKKSNSEYAESLEASINSFREKIYNDKGRFKYEGKIDGVPVWQYYGFKNEREFKAVASSLSKNTVRDLADKNIRAHNEYGNMVTRMENSGGGIYRQLFNDGSNLNKIMDGGTGFLAASADRFGKNIFAYMNDILDAIHEITPGGKKKRRYRGPAVNSKNKSKNNNTSSGSSGSTDESSDTEEPPQQGEMSDEEKNRAWDNLEAERLERQREQEEEAANQGRLGKIVDGIFGRSKLGKALNSVGGLLGDILRAPMRYATKLLDKADNAMFKMMFGDGKFTDDEGKPIGSVFDYMIYKVKKGVNEIHEEISKILQPAKDWIKNILTPVFQNVREMLGKGKDRIKKSLDNTFGRLGRKIFKGRVVSADEVESAANGQETSDNQEDINTSAMGRLVTKRGLTMISPGEMIIPATFDKKKQKQQLAAEKRDRARIIKSIGLNAEGTFDTSKIEEQFRKMYNATIGKNGKANDVFNEAKANGSKLGAGGILGFGASILTGFNPLIGAVAGAGITLLSTSKTFKEIVFGKEDEKGNRQGGIIPKKVIDFFKKNAGDMLDFGVAGGVLGLFSPFGVLGGAVMGAGVGFLKNNETFKKFIFGKDGEGGLISKDTQKKFTDFAKKAAPNVAIGTVAGALLGPFGILGNAAMGAGLGMLASTNTFHKFLFGDKDEGTDGIMGAFKRGVLEPAGKIVSDIKKKFDGYLEKNIFNPLKNFGKTMAQEIRNVITNIGDKISDHLKKSYEKNIGLPMRDFIQERLLKPLTKLTGGLLKGLLGIGGKAVAAPFSLMNWVANNTRAKQIKRGQAYDMTAQERLDWRKEHKVRMATGDRYRAMDETIAGMSDENVSEMSELLNAYGGNAEQATKNLGKAKKATSNAMSKYFNEGMRDRIGVGAYNKIAKAASSGDWNSFKDMVNKNKKLTDEDKELLLKNMGAHVNNIAEAQKGMKYMGQSDEEILARMEQLTGKKYKAKDIRIARRNFDSEDKGRKKKAYEGKKESEAITDQYGNEVEGGEYVIAKTAQQINDSINEQAKAIIEKLTSINDNFETVLGKKKEEQPSEANPVAEAAKEMDKPLGLPAPKNLLGLPAPASEESEGSDDGETQGSRAIKAQDEEEKQEEKDQVQADQLDEQKKSRNLFQRMYDKLFGKGKDNDDRKRKHGFFGALSNGFAGILGALGVGTSKIGKILGTAVKVGIGLSLIGHFSGLLKDKVLPAVSKLLFGTAKEDGTRQGGLLGPVINWVKSPDGLQKFLSEKAIPWLVSGVGLVSTNIITPLVAGIVNSLPSIAWATVKGIWIGVKSIFNKDKSLPGETERTFKADVGSGDNSLAQGVNSINEYSSKLSSGLPSSISKLSSKVTVPGMSSSLSGIALPDSASSVEDLSGYENGDNIKYEDSNGKKQKVKVVEDSAGNKHISSTHGYTDKDIVYKDEDRKRTYVRAGGLAGLLGAKKSTNEVQYNSDGSVATQMTTRGYEDSFLSGLARVLGRGFLNGATGIGDSGASILTKLKGKGVGKGLFKGTTGLLSKLGNIFGSGAEAITGAGKAFRAKLNGENASEAFMSSLSDGWLKRAVEAGKNGGGIKEIFNAIRNKKDKKKGFIGKIIEEVGENGLKEGTKNLFSETGLGKVVNVIKDQGLKNGAKNLFSGTGLGKVVNVLKDEGLKNGAKSLFDKSFIGRNVIDFKNAFGKNANSAVDAILGTEPTGFFTKAKSAMQKAVVDFKNIPSTLKDAFGKKAVGETADAVVDNAAKTVAGNASDRILKETAEEVSEKAVTEGVTNTLEGLAPTIFKKVAKFLTKQIGETAITKAMKEIGERLCKNIFTKLAGKAIKAVATAVEGIPIIGIIMIVLDFLYGYDNAATFLGVTKDSKTFKVNFGHRCLCGLLNVINEKITLGLMPPELIIDIIVDILFPILGIDAKSLKKAREEAGSDIAKYNEEHPEDTVDNLKDYNDKDKWWYKPKKAIEKLTAKAWSGIKSAFTSNKDKDKDKENESSNTTLSNSDIQTNAAGGFVTRGGLSMVSAGETILNKSGVSEVLNSLNPLSIFGNAYGFIRDKLKDSLKTYRQAKNNIDVSDLKLDSSVRDDDVDVFTKDYWTIKTANKGEGIIGILGEIESYLDRIINAPLLIVKNVGGKFLETLDASKSLLGDKFKNVWEWVKSFFGGGKARTKTSTNKKKSLWQKLFGKGRHKYQDDPSIANMQYGDSTIAEAGCGPVAAANVINSMKRGKGMSVGNAARYAEDHDMTVNGGGTDINYFKSIFNSQGIPAKTTDNKSEVLNSLKNGNQVVMLGKDKEGSKSSPFGDDYHYVTAKGLDTDGNILAEDPDLPQSTVKYKTKDMLDSMISSVATSKINGRMPKKGGKGRKSRLFGRRYMEHDFIDGDDPIMLEANTRAPDKKLNNYPAGTEVLNNFPYFSQYDDKWGPQSYGPTTIKAGGCGPTSTAMVLRSYGVDTDPKQMADFSIAHGDRTATQGTAHQLFYDAANAYGLTCKNVGGSLDAIKNTLSSGIPLIASGTGAVPYSGCGHIITFVGLDEKGRVVVNDPVSRERSVAYDDGVITSGLANTYSIDSDGKGSLSGATINPKYQNKNGTTGGTTSGSSTGSSSSSSGYNSSSSPSTSGNSSSSSGGSTTTGNLFTAITNLGKSIMKAMFGENAFNALFGDSESSDDGSSSSGGTTSNSSGFSHSGGNSYTTNSIQGTSNGSAVYNPKSYSGKNNEEKIWNALRSKGLNAEAAAGVMGNLMKESGLISKQLENGYEQPASYYGDNGTWPGFTDSSYTDYVDKEGKWPEYGASGWDYYNKCHRDDLKNHVGYGLAGWTHCAFKDPFLAGARANKVSIGDAGYQTNFLLDQVNGQYSDLFSRMNGYNDVKQSTIDFFNTYEYGAPGKHMEETHPDLFANRYEYASEFYKKYKDMKPGVNNDNNTDQEKLANGETASKDYTADPDEKTERELEKDARQDKVNQGKTSNENNTPTVSAKGRRLYGRGRDGLSTGVATNALNRLSTGSVSNEIGPVSSSTIGANGSVSYDQFLKTIVEILSSIAGNTAVLGKILQVLSDKFGLDISADDVNATVNSGRTKAKDALSQLVSRSSNNNVNVSNILNMKDTDYILKAMAAVATE